MKIGFLGLGKMGSRMVEKILLDGHEVIAWNRSEEAGLNLESRIRKQEASVLGKLHVVKTIIDLIKYLEKPRIIWLMLPAGEATQAVLDEVEKHIQSGDILIDGGNANWEDTQERFTYFANLGVKYLGIGVSGGILAAEKGYPLMAGGEQSAYDLIKPVLDTLAAPYGGHTYFGTGGAGHFVKMVHNGIEYGMMQAIAEGFGVLEKSPYGLDLLEVAKLYQKETIISGFLLDRTRGALMRDPKLSQIEGLIDATGEAEWTVAAGKKENVYVENIAQALDFRRRSKNDANVSSSFAARMVAALRHEFGGHKVKKKP